MDDSPVDFAISYAGEDEPVAREVVQRLREYGFEVFFAPDAKEVMVGGDGEDLFERLFSEAKEVVVFVSKAYRRKPWTRFEWDVIKDRQERFVAVRLDDTRILGLSSNIFYARFSGSNYDEIARTCIRRLLAYERRIGHKRPSEFEAALNAIRSESRGALAEAFQLVKDGRKRDPLEPITVPSVEPIYRVFATEWVNFSVVKRRAIKIAVPPGLSTEDLRDQLKHAAASQFNALRPDAVVVHAYIERGDQTGEELVYSAGRCYLAPFGSWEKAQDGVAYNLPSSEFDFALDLSPDYFGTPKG